MNSPEIIEIPPDLAARASAVPGLAERLRRYIGMEISLHEERQKRYRPEILDLVQRARETAARRRAEGFDRDAALAGFEENYHSLMSKSD